LVNPLLTSILPFKREQVEQGPPRFHPSGGNKNSLKKNKTKNDPSISTARQ
jgi:hypothetical protein